MLKFLRKRLASILVAAGGLAGTLGPFIGAVRADERPDVAIADFEDASYGEWKTTGDAFGSGPARGTLVNQMPVTGFRGQGLVNTYLRGDGSTGTLTSPEWKIERPFITFLIGGGKDPEKLALQLLINGKVVRSATGSNDRPGGSEELAPDAWDVSEFQGQVAVLRIVDNATGGWGHINVDHVMQSTRRPPGTLVDARREFQVEHRYLHLPIKNNGKRRQVTLIVDGRSVVRNEIELADGEPDWWAPLDVSAWRGRSVALMVDRLSDDSQALRNIDSSDSLKGGESLYAEPLRGRFHFSPRRGWNNDPNGMVFFNGEYHLFFQHNPYGWNWGNMHWGHAVSKDLVRWQELGDKLWPDQLGPMFSGSAVVDHENTSGFGRDGRPPLVLLYTAAGNPTAQCLAYSLDGRTFQKYERNPVVPQVTPGNRDPKVIWHAATKRWVMVLYVELKGRHTVHFLVSPDLKTWTTASVFDGGTAGRDGYLYECPDFFELPVSGRGAAAGKSEQAATQTRGENRKWVLLGANSEYAVGSFDGTKFHAEFERLPGQHGRGFYAPQTFSDIDSRDGRRIQIGWFQTATPGMPFNQSMTVPHELRLVETGGGPRLTRTPVRELESLRTATRKIEPRKLSPGDSNPLAGWESELLELRAEFEPTPGSQVTFQLRGVAVTYDAAKEELAVAGHRAPAKLLDGRMQLVVYLDRTGLEVFASNGLVYLPFPIIVSPDDRSVVVKAAAGTAEFHRLEASELKSSWTP